MAVNPTRRAGKSKVLAKGVFLLPLLTFGLLLSCSTPQRKPTGGASQGNVATDMKSGASAASPPAPPILQNAVPAGPKTEALMHNVILNERPGLQLRVRWLRGEMHPTRPGIVPSFDEPNSFVLAVEAGVVATSLADISGLLNGGLLQGLPLDNVSLAAEGKRLKLQGTLHKGVPLPIEMVSDIAASPDGRIRLHTVKLPRPQASCQGSTAVVSRERGRLSGRQRCSQRSGLR